MISESDRGTARKLMLRLSTTVPLLDLVVFGSRARGDAASDSDLDVFITVEHMTPELRTRISEIAWELGLQNGVVISTIVASREDLAHGPMAANPLLAHVKREGVRP